MQHTARYCSPMGEILLAGDEAGLTGLWFCGAKYFARGLDPHTGTAPLPVLTQAAQWLDRYFSGEDPGPLPPLHLVGTPFQRSVWEVLLTVPYGQTTTYGAIARTLVRQRGLPRLSAQAVGGAVGRNPISVIVPCHRVLGADGSLTGYAGGVEKKRLLLELEGVLPAPAAAEGAPV